MAKLPSYFQAFLCEIRPTDSQRDECKKGHTTLRDRLLADDDLKPHIVSTFLQGSYRRHTAVRPQGDTRSDVDVIVVTDFSSEEFTPKEVLKKFEPFLERHYKGKWNKKGRSFGIELSYVSLDLVVTSAPSEAEANVLRSASQMLVESDSDEFEPPLSWIPSGSLVANRYEQIYSKSSSSWKMKPLHIPDREANIWDETHPLAQIAATWIKSKATNGHFVNVVKCVKWWKLTQHAGDKYPKGYPLEHLFWISCPDGVASVAEGVTEAFEDFVERYKTNAITERKPFIPDHGVPGHDVLARLSDSDFMKLYRNIEHAASKAREALDFEDVCESADLWRELFGEKFPRCPDRQGKSAYTPRTEVSALPGGRFA